MKILLLQNNCINNGVTNDQNNRNKKACKTASYGKTKERRERQRVKISRGECTYETYFIFQLKQHNTRQCKARKTPIDEGKSV